MTNSPTPNGLTDEQRRAIRLEQKRKWNERRRRSEGVKPLRLAPCGTTSAYRRHLRRKEKPCAACAAAWATAAREKRAQKRAGGSATR